MAKRKRSNRGVSKRKRARTSRNVPRRRLKLRTAMMSYKRKFFLQNWAPNTTTTAGFWRRYQSQLTDIPNSAELTALFDQYKINAIKLEFLPRFDNFSGNDTTDTAVPGITNQSGTNVHVSYDTYTTITPGGTYNSANCNTFLEQGRVKTYTGTKPITIFYKPTLVDNGRYVKPRWLSTDFAVPATHVHYGPNVFMQDINFNGSFGQTFDVFLTMYVQVRNMK